MSSKWSYYIAVFIGSTLGSYIPTLWGAGFLSLSSVFFSGVGGILGIVIVYKFLQK